MKIYKNLIYLWIFIIVVISGSLVLAFLVYNKSFTENQPLVESQDLQTYENQKFGYSIEYPSDWKFREYPNTQTGAGFQPIASPNELSSECIHIDARGTLDSENDTPFDEYVKRAGIVEIEGYKKLNSIETIATVSGLTGYKTTWSGSWHGQEGISSPITYFENNKSFWVSGGSMQYKTVQVTLENSSQDCEDVYNQMIKTFTTRKGE